MDPSPFPTYSNVPELVSLVVKETDSPPCNLKVPSFENVVVVEIDWPFKLKTPDKMVRVPSISRPFVERVTTPAPDLLTVKWLKSCPTPVPPVTTVEFPEPSNVTVLEPEVNVPALVQLPPTLILFPAASRVP